MGKVESLGVIINADETIDFETVKLIANTFKVRESNLKIIAFSATYAEMDMSWNTCYYSTDFAWNGKVNNPELQMFLDTKFDALVSYYSQDVLELKFLTATSKAKFKIGGFSLDPRLNDLIIHTDYKDIKGFNNELFKYGRVLNII